jgi:predicted nucleotidyltransferase
MAGDRPSGGHRRRGRRRCGGRLARTCPHVLGSIARGETAATSDVDLLVEMEPGRSLIDLVGLWQDLEDLLGTHVDVLSEGGVSPLLHERIYADAVAL